MNLLRDLLSFTPRGVALCFAKELGAIVKLALSFAIAVILAVNFPEIRRSGGSGSLVARKIKLYLHPRCIRGAKSLCHFRVGSPLLVLVSAGGGDSEYLLVAKPTSVHSAELDELLSLPTLRLLSASVRCLAH